MSSFIRYQNEVEVTSVPLGVADVWTEVDLSSFLDDTSAIGVLLRLRSTSTGSPFPTAGVREVGATYTSSAQLLDEYYCEFAVGFGGSGNSIEWWENAAAPSHELFVIGEIHGTDVKLHDEAIEIAPPADTWTDVVPTLIGGDVLNDIKAVILRVRNEAVSSVGSFGLRQKGSTDPFFDCAGDQGHDWYVIGVVDDDAYQVYTSFESGFTQNAFYEIGYVLNTSRIDIISPPQAEGLAEQFPTFGEINFSGVNRLTAYIVGGRWVQPSTSPRAAAFLQSVIDGGSTDGDGGSMGRPNQSVGSQSVRVNRLKIAGYIAESLGGVVPDFHLQWFEDVPYVINPEWWGKDFRGRNDDGPSEIDPSGGGATWIADINTDWSQLTDVNFRVRFLVQSLASGGSFTWEAHLGVSHNGGAYTFVDTTSSVVKLVDTAYWVNRDETEDFVGRLGTGLWMHGDHFQLVDGDDGNPYHQQYTHQHSRSPFEYETEMCLQIVKADVSDGDTIELRVFTEDLIPLQNGYDYTPLITVNSPPNNLDIVADIEECPALSGVTGHTVAMSARMGAEPLMRADTSIEVMEGAPSATVGVDMDGELSAEPALKVKIHLAGGR